MWHLIPQTSFPDQLLAKPLCRSLLCGSHDFLGPRTIQNCNRKETRLKSADEHYKWGGEKSINIVKFDAKPLFEPTLYFCLENHNWLVYISEVNWRK